MPPPLSGRELANLPYIFHRSYNDRLFARDSLNVPGKIVCEPLVVSYLLRSNQARADVARSVLGFLNEQCNVYE